MAHLKIISGGLSGKSYEIEGLVTLGRSSNNSLAFKGVDGGMVSTEHAEVCLKEGALYLVDKNSTNGTFVNGERIEKCKVRHDDIISLGLNGPKIRVINMEGSQEPLRHANHPLKNFWEKSDSQSHSGNYTLGLSKRIMSNDADTKEIHKLIKNKSRLGRMEAGAQLPEKELHNLKRAGKLYHRHRKIFLTAISGITLVGFLVISILLYQNFSYRVQLKRQNQLIEEIQSINQQLGPSHVQSGISDSERLQLVSRLRAQERLLLKLRNKIDGTDLKTLYKDPMGVEIHKIMRSFGEEDYLVPEIFIKQVRKYVKVWNSSSSFVKRGIANKRIHGDLILRELNKANMPAAFLYLAMHESSLDSVIVSKAGARGIWQFMPSTARRYGLQVPKNWRDLPPHEDERTNPLASTQAAIKYLKHLVADFGTIPLAMASYNAGEGRIRRELRKIPDPINHRDFWFIYRSGTLARETNEYVPKIVATMLLDQNPDSNKY